jgi:Tfp pilus assembly protein PilV
MQQNLVKINNNKSGYALLEILLAFAVATIIMTGMVSLGVSTVRAVTVNRAYSEAGKIAQREVDRLKLLRDTYPAIPTKTSWENFYDNVVVPCTTNCYVVTGAPFTKSSGTATVGTPPSAISYSFKFTSTGVTSPAKYEVNTSWDVGAVTKYYKIEGVFTNWRDL